MPSKKVQRRKSKAIEDSIKIMNNFKRSLIEAEPLKKKFSNITSKKTKKNKMKSKSTLIPAEKSPAFKAYSAQKFIEKELSPKFKKMYTPNQIYNWVNTSDTQINVSTSSKNIRYYIFLN
jgi:hypothetical protein